MIGAKDRDLFEQFWWYYRTSGNYGKIKQFKIRVLVSGSLHTYIRKNSVRQFYWSLTDMTLQAGLIMKLEILYIKYVWCNIGDDIDTRFVDTILCVDHIYQLLDHHITTGTSCHHPSSMGVTKENIYITLSIETPSFLEPIFIFKTVI